MCRDMVKVNIIPVCAGIWRMLPVSHANPSNPPDKGQTGGDLHVWMNSLVVEPFFAGCFRQRLRSIRQSWTTSVAWNLGRMSMQANKKSTEIFPKKSIQHFTAQKLPLPTAGFLRMYRSEVLTRLPVMQAPCCCLSRITMVWPFRQFVYQYRTIN